MGGARLIACLAAMLLVPPAAAQAAYPGTNGKLAFVRDGHIWTMNADGTGAAQLTTGTADASDPEWSPDGTRIAFVRNLSPQRRLATINADGTGEAPFPVFIPGENGDVYAPTWSPDGRRLAYILSYDDNENCFCRVWEMRSTFANHFSPFGLDGAQWSPSGTTIALSEQDDGGVERIYKVSVTPGTAPAPIGNGVLRDFGPAWSPDAAKVAYISQRDDVNCSGPQPSCRHEVQVANADNTGITRLTDNGAAEYDVEWAPDGSKLVYSGVEPGCTSCSGPDLHVMNPDGTGRVRITNTAAGEFQPDWQPVVSGPGPGYPRPAGAAPLRVSLVPTYASCTAPNREHGPPLAFGSCNPPALRSLESHGRHARRQRRGSEHDGLAQAEGPEREPDSTGRRRAEHHGEHRRRPLPASGHSVPVQLSGQYASHPGLRRPVDGSCVAATHRPVQPPVARRARRRHDDRHGF